VPRRDEIVLSQQQGANESIPVMEPSADSDYIVHGQELNVLRVAQRKEARLAAVFAAVGLLLTPAVATSMPAKKRLAAVALSFDPVSSFTPANADPKLAAALAGKGLALTDFKFTPAPAIEYSKPLRKNDCFKKFAERPDILASMRFLARIDKRAERQTTAAVSWGRGNTQEI
jgi:hypothetical protein